VKIGGRERMMTLASFSSQDSIQEPVYYFIVSLALLSHAFQGVAGLWLNLNSCQFLFTHTIYAL
jgi:hypothetical protein